MPHFFVPGWQNTLFIIVFIISLLQGFWVYGFSLALLYGGYLFLFRKKKSFYREDPSEKRRVVFSPVNGRITAVRSEQDHCLFGENLLEVQMQILPWNEIGLYLPVAGEVSEVVRQAGRSFLRRFSAIKLDQSKMIVDSVALKVKGKDDEKIGIQLLECPLGMSSQVEVMPGDRGQKGVCFGHFPLGGTVFLYMPSEFALLAKSGDRVIAGETLIAGIRNE
jgi:phosphatidylserine decarboxylase